MGGTYGLLKGGTDAVGQPTTGVSQLTFDSTKGTYTGEDTASHDGVILRTARCGENNDLLQSFYVIVAAN